MVSKTDLKYSNNSIIDHSPSFPFKNVDSKARTTTAMAQPPPKKNSKHAAQKQFRDAIAAVKRDEIERPSLKTGQQT